GGDPRAVTRIGALPVGLDVSARTAPTGSRIAVPVRADGGLAEPLQGLQAYLRYDPSRLAYVGQPTQGGGLVLVNDAAADRGELRFISVDAGGLPARVATLIFPVKSDAYNTGLRLPFEGPASLPGG